MDNAFNTLLRLEARDPEFTRAYAAEILRIEAIDDASEKRGDVALARTVRHG